MTKSTPSALIAGFACEKSVQRKFTANEKQFMPTDKMPISKNSDLPKMWRADYPIGSPFQNRKKIESPLPNLAKVIIINAKDETF
jgi:hypothetical protein